MKYILIGLGWTGYCALHSYLISIGFTNRMTRWLKKYYAFYRIFYVLLSLVLLIPLINYTAQSDSEIIITYGQPWNIVRVLVLCGSLAIFFWAFFISYDSLAFWGIRPIIKFWKIKTTDPSDEINKNGLLGIIRHPMYFALIIYLWCQTYKISDLVVNTVLTIYIFIGTILEEKKLVLKFGETYIKYQQEVPMVIPFTRRKRKEHQLPKLEGQENRDILPHRTLKLTR